jgi:hypothetical protein
MADDPIVDYRILLNRKAISKLWKVNVLFFLEPDILMKPFG